MENGSSESLKMTELLKEIEFKGIGAFNEEVFVRVQKQALEVINGAIGSEMERPH